MALEGISRRRLLRRCARAGRHRARAGEERWGAESIAATARRSTRGCDPERAAHPDPQPQINSCEASPSGWPQKERRTSNRRG